MVLFDDGMMGVRCVEAGFGLNCELLLLAFGTGKAAVVGDAE